MPEPPEFPLPAEVVPAKVVPTVGKIGDLAAEAGISRVHMLAWRDLADVEAGGSEIHASTVASLWAQAGIDVTMRTSYAQGSPPLATRDGYRVIRKAGRYLVFPRAALAEATGRHGRRDALVEIWNGVPFLSPVWARGPRVTWLHHVHTEMWPLVLPGGLARVGQFVESRLAPPFYRRTSVVTLSESSKVLLLQRLGFRPENVHVVPPGISPMFAPGGIKSAESSVLAVGRLMPPKAFDELIEAMVRVREAIPATLTIIGEGYSRDALEHQISRLGAEQWCELLGRVDDDTLVQRYQAAWVVAASSKSEGWGMTLTEAAAVGTPAVATRIPGHVDAVIHGVTGMLVDSSAELVEALVNVLSNQDLRERMGVEARRRALAFTWERTAYDTMAVLAADARRTRYG
ncbi:MAG: glycosyltransferase family 4 protein [Acidimicrobiaceae bacterium]|nr:glycosyltransferase family 4 protein [Acidimicrobiaceae bacterium]